MTSHDEIEYTNIFIPHLKKTIHVPTQLSTLIYEMNIRGYATSTIIWNEVNKTYEIDLESHKKFLNNIEQHKRSKNKYIYEYVRYLINEKIEFKLTLNKKKAGVEPYNITLILPQSQIQDFKNYFHNAFIVKHKDNGF